MKNQLFQESAPGISTIEELAQLADYSFMDTLNRDPQANENGADHDPRQVFSGHYVPVKPTPIENPEYVAHSWQFFQELGLADSLAESAGFMRVFSGDLSQVPAPMRPVGWATGYALSIFGTEYIQQCPFQTGNGYGDGRAMSVLEAVIPDRNWDQNGDRNRDLNRGRRWEMQLKGGGRTPYCRGADGRAVLRSSVREFLAQEHMHALGVPTSRSLSLYVSKTERVQRPWYSEGSRSHDPDRIVSEAVAISTRVAPSFIRVGQLELFGRRARKQEHSAALAELEQLVLHLVDREYAEVIDPSLSTPEKVVLLAREFRHRLTSLVANWIRVGYCQGNFNSDNTQAGGITLDYGPFGFMEVFDPYYQPWTGGGEHFSFWNQPVAAERNFEMFCTALRPLLEGNYAARQQLDEIRNGFANAMQEAMQNMFAAKLGLETLDVDLFNELASLMMQTSVDYTIFFRELSSIPEDIGPLKKSFYGQLNDELEQRWAEWLTKWKSLVTNAPRTPEEISAQMKRVNPKYSLREWLLAPAYQQAARGNYDLIHELQDVMTQPYAEQSPAIEEKYYRQKPPEVSDLGGVSHMSCSS
ncbi:protein adenylyltransferase SelO [Thiohalophilus sp.]|uniref:protein adenylyltransferase SelO n=1 Tax=Thiohalophilus sp. TaxID=3028392 RepID=UPI002ACD982A|nr:protein adenylyltransferase SelO family protein [Thiohalophilus sp.]MDZ7661660.1 protein adenylyltransferase SelO family protein [Thiohalophilus sp.]